MKTFQIEIEYDIFCLNEDFIDCLAGFLLFWAAVSQTFTHTVQMYLSVGEMSLLSKFQAFLEKY